MPWKRISIQGLLCRWRYGSISGRLAINKRIYAVGALRTTIYIIVFVTIISLQLLTNFQLIRLFEDQGRIWGMRLLWRRDGRRSYTCKISTRIQFFDDPIETNAKQFNWMEIRWPLEHWIRSHKYIPRWIWKRMVSSKLYKGSHQWSLSTAKLDPKGPQPMIVMSKGRSGSTGIFRAISILTGQSMFATEYTSRSPDESDKFFTKHACDEGEWLLDYLSKYKKKIQRLELLGLSGSHSGNSLLTKAQWMIWNSCPKRTPR